MYCARNDIFVLRLLFLKKLCQLLVNLVQQIVSTSKYGYLVPLWLEMCVYDY